MRSHADDDVLRTPICLRSERLRSAPQCSTRNRDDAYRERRHEDIRKRTRPREQRERERTTREPELPGGSPPRSRRPGRREHGAKLLTDHGLHDRVALVRGPPKPRVRTENLLAGALGVPVAILVG